MAKGLKIDRRRGLALFASVLLAGCSGRIGDPLGQADRASNPTPGGGNNGGTTPGGGTNGGSNSGGANGGGTTPVSACTGDISPGRSPLRRLNGGEYDNTVRDLIRATKAYSTQFPPDEESLGFSNNADALVVNNLLAEGYESAAEEMAANAVTNLGALAPACNPTSMGAATCASSFIKAFGQKAFRRPLATDEVTRYLGLFTTGSTGATYNDGISLVIEAMLQSPYFLYRVETGVATAIATVAALTPYELATRLSYFLWQSIPDTALFAAADGNQLSTPDQITGQAQRMLQDTRAHQMVTKFHREWLLFSDVLSASKAATLYPQWTPQLVVDVMQEADTFADQVYWNDGNLSTFLTAPYSYLNANVAANYGLAAPAGTGFVKTALDATQRSGILTLGAFLAGQAKPDQSSPILRGKFVRERLLCQEMPPPPNNIVITVPEVTAGTSTRQRFSAHDTQPLCAGCHTLMDPLGYAFESFDAVGRWRTMDGPVAVDTTGEIKGAVDPATNGPFNGAVELGKKLAASPDVATCVATEWFRWGNGRQETKEDACSMETIVKQFQAANFDMRTLPAAIVTTDAFRYRTAGGAQ